MISSLLLGRLGFRAGMPLAQCALWDSRHALRGSGVGEGNTGGGGGFPGEGALSRFEGRASEMQRPDG